MFGNETYDETWVVSSIKKSDECGHSFHDFPFKILISNIFINLLNLGYLNEKIVTGVKV